MLIDIVVINATMLLDPAVTTNAIALLDLLQHKIEASADVRTVLTQSGRTHVRPMLMTAATTILALIPLALSTAGSLIAASPATDWEGNRPMKGPLVAEPTWPHW
jgi:multidrug efflux pump subunit AcrB